MTLMAYYVEFFMRNTMKKKHQNWTKNKKLTFENWKIPFWTLLKKRSRLDHPKSIPTCILYRVSLCQNLKWIQIIELKLLNGNLTVYGRRRRRQRWHAHNIIRPHNICGCLKSKYWLIDWLLFNVQWQIFHAYSGRKQVSKQ